MFPPIQMVCLSDNNVLTLADTSLKSKNQKENYYIYVYTSSHTKIGMQLPVSESELHKYLSNNIFKEV